ncbi:MAG: ribosomal protein S18 acetylase RimI-like enzyme [Paraglaciecola sp.]|jgi:ribosomal protein S18 acetylase RimI-like enzyme
MSQIIIRKAKIEELPILLEFEKGVFTAERPFNPTIKEESGHYYDIEQLILSPKSECLVAEIDEKIVGSGYALIEKAKDYFTHDEHSYLGFMYVLPEYRGRGINKMVMDELIDWSKKRGITEFRLDVYTENQGAIRAYEKAGFSNLIVEMRMKLEE